MQSAVNDTFTIAKVLSTCLEKQLTFAAYRLPDRQAITVVIQKDDRLESVEDLTGLLQTGGFIVAPFGSGASKGRFVIHPDILIRNKASAEQVHVLQSLPVPSRAGGNPQASIDTAREEFLEQARQIINATRSGLYDKVVLSRIKSVKGAFASRLSDIFKLLCDSCSNAFVYLFQIKDHCWIGATPEPLLCSNEDTLVTVSMAGTRPLNETNRNVQSWNSKELSEQDCVTRQIEGILSDFNVSGVKSGPCTRRAGALLHLCTEFTFSYRSVASKLAAFIDALHPTSAVCGIPKDKSMQLITTIEKHDREFYAGYLGPVGLDDRVQLFVNLRCMKVCKNHSVLFVGGGITSDSVPEDEWEETEMKAETLLSVVREVD
jgi:isochorismate synthase